MTATPHSSARNSPLGGLCCGWLFFFSSRSRHTRCGRDWSSDVCSSDLLSVIRERSDQLLRRLDLKEQRNRLLGPCRWAGSKSWLFRWPYCIVRTLFSSTNPPAGSTRLPADSFGSRYTRPPMRALLFLSPPTTSTRPSIVKG